MQSSIPNPTNTMTFELLELAWWQNPWYYIAIVGLLVVIICGAIVWYFKYRRNLTPEEKIIERLQAVSALSHTTQAQQKYIYEQLTRLIKEFAALVYKQPASMMLGLTDQEFVPFIQKLHVPEQLLLISQKIFDSACTVKFAEQTIASAEIGHQITQLEQVLTKIVQETTKQA